MAQILLPTSDQATGAWVSTPLWSKVDDDSTVNPTGDGTVITSDDNTNLDTADFPIASGSDPSVSTGHILRARWNKDSAAGHTINAYLELYEGDPGSGGTLIASQVISDIGATEQEDTYTLSAAEANAITDYTNLYLRVRRGGDTGGNPNGRRSLVVDLVEFEVPDAGASPVSVELVAATITATPQSLGLSLGALSTQLAPATASLAAQALGVSLGAASIELVPATASLAAQALGISLGAKTVELSPATASLVAQVLGVDIAGSPVTVELTPATMTVAPQALGISLSPLSVELQPATASLVAQALGLSVGVSTVLVPATVSIAPQPLGVSLGAKTVELTPAELSLIAQVLGVDIVGGDPFEDLRIVQVNIIGPW